MTTTTRYNNNVDNQHNDNNDYNNNDRNSDNNDRLIATMTKLPTVTKKQWQTIATQNSDNNNTI